MALKAWFIIFALIVGNVFFGIKAVQVWSEGAKTVPAIVTHKRQIKPVEKKMVKRVHLPEATYEDVVKNNLFRPDRSEVVAQEGSVKAKHKKNKVSDEKLLKLLQATVKRIELYGVLLVDKQKKALIRSPTFPVSSKPGKIKPPPGEDLKWVKVGDPVNRFTVKEITKNGVILGAEGLDFDVILFDEEKPKKRAPQKKVTGPIVFGAGKEGEASNRPEKKAAREVKAPQKESPVVTVLEEKSSQGNHNAELEKRRIHNEQTQDKK